MTTATYSSVINTGLDSEFRAWTKELSDTLQACGLTKTTDTGQINFVTVARPAVANTAGGYEIYKFNDALQSSAPVFIKIEYGIGTNANMPQFWITVGSSASGTGVLNGNNIQRVQCCWNRSSITPTQNTSYVTKVCVSPGYVMVSFKHASLGTSPDVAGFFLVGRTIDQNNGAQDGKGVVLYRYYADSNTALGHVAYSLNFASGKQTPAGGFTEQHHFVPFDVTSSMVNGTDVQLFRHFYSLPELGYHPWIATYLYGEIAEGTLFSATLVGTTPRTYLALGTKANYSGANRNGNHCNIVLFE